MWGKLSWEAVPFHEPIVMVTSAVVAIAITAVLAWVIVKGHLPYIWKEWLSSVDHKRIGVMYIVLALVMLLRGFADAIMMRSQQAVAMGNAGFLPPEHYNQIFSAHGTIMIFFVAMPFVIGLMNFAVPLQLGARDVAFPGAQLGRLLAHRHRRAAGQHLALHRRVRAHRLAALSAALRARLLARSRRRLLPVGAADLGRRNAAVRRQPGDDRAQGAGAGHDLPAHADLLLDHARLQPAHRRRVPDPHRHPGDAPARPLSRLPLLHQRGRRQPDDVHEPHLGLGAPRGLHPGAAGVRHLLGGVRHVLGQAALRLPLDGRGDDGDLHPLLHGLAAPLLHHGRGRRRQRDLRHRHDDHRRAHGREDLQLAVHDVQRPRRLRARRCSGRSASSSPSSSAE